MGLESVSYIEDLVITNPVAADPRSEGDDHLRNLKVAIKACFPGLAGRSWRFQDKGSNYTAVANDNMSVINCTAAITLSLTAAATLGNGWLAVVYASGGAVTVDPNGAETVNGSATQIIPSGMMGLIFGNGTAFYMFNTKINPGSLNSGTMQATTSGATITFSSIPDWVKRVTILFAGLSSSGSGDNYNVQLGDSGGLENTGYYWQHSVGTAANNDSSQRAFSTQNGAVTYSGRILIEQIDSATNLWLITCHVAGTSSGTVVVQHSIGYKALSATLDRVALLVSAGAFDAGSMNILYE